MKQINKLTIILLVSIIPVCAHAQLEKGAQITREILQAKMAEQTMEVAQKAQPELFAWPKELETYIRANILTNEFGKTALSPVTNNITHSIATEQLVVIQDAVESKTLSALKQETDFYQPEINTGRQLRVDLLKVSSLSEPVKNELKQSINALHSNTLKELLNTHLETGDLKSFYQDLTDYYALDGNEVQTTYNYLLRHPHKPTLWLRRMLRNPLVDRRLQKQATKFLSYDVIAPEAFPVLQQTLERIQHQVAYRVKQAQTSDIVLERMNFLRQLTTDVEEFIAQKGFRPNTNTLDPMEFELAKRVEWALTVMPSMTTFEPLASEFTAFQNVWTAHEPIHWSYEETMDKVESFVKETGIMPRPLQTGVEISAQETEIYENTRYWLLNNPATSTRLLQIQQQYEIK